ncbi:MAG: hypothetical protein IPI53_09350 [Saprospiraceae bacterium]|nr:hypothetical protein [Saprospiraceae bacterium]
MVIGANRQNKSLTSRIRDYKIVDAVLFERKKNQERVIQINVKTCLGNILPRLLGL